VVVAPAAPVLCEPPAPSTPLQPPEAVHEAALVELQVSVALPPGAITKGYTDSATAGTTLTAAVAGALVPPAPAQVSVYDVAAVTGPVLCVPLLASKPLQPPEAVHEAALVELQLSVEALPEATAPGEAIRLAVGTGATGTGATVTAAVTIGLVPPAPLHVKE